ncbi:excinuclease ABC subunit UvrA [Microbacterium sp.]
MDDVHAIRTDRSPWPRHPKRSSSKPLRPTTCRRFRGEIPTHKLTVVTGVSGSGKSSLAFDTIYAEGQRRYVETLSTYARQIVGQMQKPPVRAIRHMPPAIALKQGNRITSARSTVGTVSEIQDLLHLLFAGAGQVICYKCGDTVVAHTSQTARLHVSERHDGERAIIVGTIQAQEEGIAVLLQQLASDGHRRAMVAGEMVPLDDPRIVELLDGDVVRVVMDRVKISAAAPRLAEAIESALGFGEGIAEVVLWDLPDRPTLRYERRYRCASCNTLHHKPMPALFNTQSELGRCGRCEGHGRTVGIDKAKVIPDPRLSLAQGAIACLATPSASKWYRAMIDGCKATGVPVNTPWMGMTDADQRFILQGGVGFGGVQGYFADLSRDRYKAHVRIMIARYRGYTDCPDCDGSGLDDAARAVLVAGRPLSQVMPMRIADVREWVAQVSTDADLDPAMQPLLRELSSRLGYLEEVGIGYLTIDRRARTLSGGETHRLMLATNLGRTLTDTCYVLDEPTAGLHPADTQRLMKIVHRLRDVGNTVLVVEHDPDVIAVADHILELGPRGGERGGELTFSGTVAELRAGDTITGEMLQRRDATPPPDFKAGELLTLNNACLHNLKDVTVRFAKGALNVVTGVSGSGKSTLIHDVLHGLLMSKRGAQSSVDLGPASLEGDDFAEVIMVDQHALNKSRRSNPLTLSGVYKPVRDLFAATQQAALHGFTATAFSFNAAKGRCPACTGTGYVEIEMHFLADVRMVCETCEGKRFIPDVLGVRYRDKTIADVFDMSVEEALRFFADRRSIVSKLRPLTLVGLGYLKLGQSTSEISGGEAQRLKLASYVGSAISRGGKKLFIFDEPTVGLHMADVEMLVAALRELVTSGHTVIVVEHNTDFIRVADRVVDLGPGAGDAGGTLIFEGPVAGLLECESSVTARFV